MKAQPILENKNREKTINVGGGVVQYLHSWNYFSQTRIELAIREI